MFVQGRKCNRDLPTEKIFISRDLIPSNNKNLSTREVIYSPKTSQEKKFIFRDLIG